MKNKTYEAMRRETVEQGVRIRKKTCYQAVHETVSADYTVARILADARTAAKLSQADVATAMKTTQSVVSRIEGGSNASLETLHRYAAACGKQLVFKLV